MHRPKTRVVEQLESMLQKDTLETRRHRAGRGAGGKRSKRSGNELSETQPVFRKVGKTRAGEGVGQVKLIERNHPECSPGSSTKG